MLRLGRGREDELINALHCFLTLPANDKLEEHVVSRYREGQGQYIEMRTSGYP